MKFTMILADGTSHSESIPNDKSLEEYLQQMVKEFVVKEMGEFFFTLDNGETIRYTAKIVLVDQHGNQVEGKTDDN